MNPTVRTADATLLISIVSEKTTRMNMNPIEEAIGGPRCIISVMGDHAGECVDQIFRRKTRDIRRIGKTFWLTKSRKAQPAGVQELCRTVPTYAVFVEPAAKGGARATTTGDVAKEYSDDRELWYRLPEGLSPVTGKLDKGTSALVFDMMTTAVSGTLDIWGYAEFPDMQKPLKFRPWWSTVCAARKDMTLHPEKMESRYRAVVAVARLAEPYCVWLR